MDDKINSVGIRCPMIIYQSNLMKNIQSILAKRGIEFVFYDSQKAHKKAEYFGPLYQHKHAIIYRYFHSTHQNYTAGNNNILFIDYSVMDDSCLFVDNLGFGGFSSVVLKNKNTKEIDPSNQIKLHSYLNNKYTLYNGYNKNGPIVVSLYMDLEAIHAYHDMLPGDVEVHFLYPPSLKSKFVDSLNLYLKKHSNWKLLEQNANESDIIKNSRALVTNLDRSAFLGLVYGIPTATFGRGLWTGAHCTLDCGRNPRLLKTILAYEFDVYASDRYMMSVYDKQIMLNSDLSYIEKNDDMQVWFSKIK